MIATPLLSLDATLRTFELSNSRQCSYSMHICFPKVHLPGVSACFSIQKASKGWNEFDCQRTALMLSSALHFDESLN